MLEYAKEALGEYFDHPILALMVIFAIAFAAAGVGLDMAIDKPLAAGFGGVYAVLSLALAAFGYTILYTYKVISMARDESATYLSN